MAGRGRGRGQNISFNVEALGITKGESLPASLERPPPHFPPLRYKAVPLIQTDEESYLLALKQEFCTAIKDLPYYYMPEEKKKDIVRYSDKYQNGNNEVGGDWQPDWSYMPDELKIRKVKIKMATPNINTRKKKLGEVNVAQTLKNLEEKEKQQEKGETGEGTESEEENEGEEVVEEQVYDEEEMEEETDYILSYFDNGESLDEDDDNLDDGPTYS